MTGGDPEQRDGRTFRAPLSIEAMLHAARADDEIARALMACKAEEDYTLVAMQPFKAVVKNGRLMVDEPTELPEGTEIELLPVDDDFDPQERARLLQAIDEGIEDFERGDHVDGFDFIAQMRSRREAANR